MFGIISDFPSSQYSDSIKTSNCFDQENMSVILVLSNALLVKLAYQE